MKFSYLIFATLLASSFPSLSESYSLYLVRHAEKQADGTKDPDLTRCGHARAKQLAYILKNINIEIIYSTHYNRTMQTATPTAMEKSITIKQYAPNGLPQLIRTLTQKKQNALIIGHSNTTPQLLAALSSQKTITMAENAYQHLFQVHIQEGKTQVIDITQPLQCN